MGEDKGTGSFEVELPNTEIRIGNRVVDTLLVGVTVKNEVELPKDSRDFLMVDATIGLLDARGMKLTLDFMKGAKFREIKMDDETKFYDLENNRIKSEVIPVKEGGYKTLKIQSP